MKSDKQHYFTLKDIAIAYALAAERIFANDSKYIDANECLKPIIGSHLFQSLEISIKHACISSGLFSAGESRSKLVRSGHGIRELAELAITKLGGKDCHPLINAMTFTCRQPHAQEVLIKMTRRFFDNRSRGQGITLQSAS